jgi:tetratricopeptide (TPR) repeat protein
VIAELVLALALQTPTQQPQPQPPTPQAIETALARDPRTLPVAAADKWRAWKPVDEVPAQLRGELGEGMRAYAEGDYGRALACFFALLDCEPDYPAALYQSGSTYFRLRRYGDCAVVLERFARAAPGEIGATQALGHSYYSIGQYEKAREHYAKVVAAAPKSVEAWRGLGLAHMRLGDDAHALECLERALELKPDHAEARGWYAQVLFDAGRTDEALAAAERARELAPFEPRHWFLLATIYGELGRDEAASKARERFAELNRIEQKVRALEGLLLHDPRAIDPLQRLVVLQSSAHNSLETREAVQRLLRVAPQDLSNHLLVLQAFQELQDRESAGKCAAQIERLFATRVDAWRALSEYYTAIGDAAGLKRADERVRALAPAK